MEQAEVEFISEPRKITIRITPPWGEAVELELEPDDARDFSNRLGAAIKHASRNGVPMSEVTGLAYWAPGEELPASREARTLAEVLAGSRRERDMSRAERQAQADRDAEAALPDTSQWIARMTGRTAVTAGEVLARTMTADGAREGGVAVADVRRARALLEEHGLSHVLPGRVSAVFDANMGTLDSPRRQPDPGIAPEDAALARAREQHEDDTRWMRRYAMRHRDVAVRAQRARERAEHEEALLVAKAADLARQAGTGRTPMIDRSGYDGREIIR